MTDDEIKLHLIEVALKTQSTKELESTAKTITTPMFDFFNKETNIAKIFFMAQVLEDQAILPVKKKMIDAYKLMNPDFPKKQELL